MLQAITLYKNDGTPYDFDCSRCETCGKAAADLIGTGLLKCAQCKSVFYCGKECQKSNWRSHKKLCGKHQAFRGGLLDVANQKSDVKVGL